jgi:hypothetical protein
VQWQQNFGLMMNDLNRFVSYVKVTLGNAFLPSLLRGLGMMTTYFKANQREIIAGIQEIGRWFYVELPHYVLQGAAFVTSGFSFMVKGVANLIRGFSDAQGPLFSFVEKFLLGIDKMVGALRIFVITATAAWAAVIAARGGPWAAAAAAVVAGGAATYLTRNMQTDLSGDFRKSVARQVDASGNPIPTIFDQATGRLDKIGQGLDGFAKTLRGWDKSLDRDAMNKQYAGMFNVLERIEENTGRKPELHAKIDVGISPQEDFYARVLAYETWSTWEAMGQTA